jgi:DNA polymerase-3 subunit delta
MKLNPRDAGAFLAAPDAKAGAALLYGPDAGLIRERAQAIVAKVLGAGYDPMNRVDLSAEQVKADPASLRDELAALSLMGGRRLVVLRDATDKLSGTIEEALLSLKTTTYLIVLSDELSATSALRKFFEQGERCAALPCYRDEGRNLEETLQTALKTHGLKATRDAMQFLLSHLGNDRGITLSEVEKIALYLGAEKEVTLQVAGKLIGHNAAEGLEDICQAVTLGQAAVTHGLLMRLVGEGTQPVAIVRALIRHFQRLETALAHVASGQSVEQALSALRPPVFFKYAPPMKRALSLWSARQVAQALALVLRTERDLKSGHLSPALVIDHALMQAARMAA